MLFKVMQNYRTRNGHGIWLSLQGIFCKANVEDNTLINYLQLKKIEHAFRISNECR